MFLTFNVPPGLLTADCDVDAALMSQRFERLLSLSDELNGGCASTGGVALREADGASPLVVREVVRARMLTVVDRAARCTETVASASPSHAAMLADATTASPSVAAFTGGERSLLELSGAVRVLVDHALAELNQGTCAASAATSWSPRPKNERDSGTRFADQFRDLLIDGGSKESERTLFLERCSDLETQLRRARVAEAVAKAQLAQTACAAARVAETLRTLESLTDGVEREVRERSASRNERTLP